MMMLRMMVPSAWCNLMPAALSKATLPLKRMNTMKTACNPEKRQHSGLPSRGSLTHRSDQSNCFEPPPVPRVTLSL